MFRKSLISLVAASLATSTFAYAQTPIAKVLHEFNGTDKASPSSNLIQLPKGDFLGMTGGPTNQTTDAGAIYLLHANGSVTTLFKFAADGSQCASGAPNLTSTGGALIQARDGNIYGVCAAGGQSGNGTVFRLTPSSFTVLHSFRGSDGSYPAGALAEGLDGNLYGVTLNGGLDPEFGGTVFRVGKDGTFTTRWLFNNQTGGSNPDAGLTLGPGGNLYGMYQQYQALSGFPGPGGIYQIDKRGNVTFPAYFQAAPWGCAPVISPKGSIVSLTQGTNFVGDGNQTLEAIPEGSSSANVVMNLPPYLDGQYVNFFGCMILAADGLLYANGISAIYQPAHPYLELQIDPAKRQVHFFDLGPYGMWPVLSPLEASDGKLYIVNNGGGKYGLGNILTLDYALAPPRPRIATFQPASGGVGTVVTIRGALFVGVQSVTLNGQAAPFRTMASGFIAFSVPSGATSGAIGVTTANGTATSASTFTVQ